MGIRERFNYEDLLASFEMFRYRGDTRIAYDVMAWLVSELGETDVRDVLRYLVRRGRLFRRGRASTSDLELPERSRPDAIMAEKIQKSSQPWDGRWSVLTYDIPVAHNRLRMRLVRLLYEMGFAKLSASSWVSPYDWAPSLVKMLKGWSAGGSSTYIRANSMALLTGDEPDYPLGAWDLDSVGIRYDRLLQRCKAAQKGGTARAQRQRLGAAVWAAQELADLDRCDPMLPRELLPADWARGPAIAAVGKLQARTAEEVTRMATA